MSAAAIRPVYLTTAEAAAYLRFGSASSIRTLVRRDELTPAGAGPRGTLLFRIEELDRFVEFRGRLRVLYVRHATPGRKGVCDANERNQDEVSGRAEDRRQDVPGEGQADGPTNRNNAGGGSTRRSAERKGGVPKARPAHDRSPRGNGKPQAHASWGLREIVDRVKGRSARR